MRDLSIIIIPTFNEIDNVENMVRAIFNESLDCHILFIDDNSPDGTASKIISLQQEFNGKLFLEQRSGKLGLGTAYIHGFKYCLERGYGYILKWTVIFLSIRLI